MVVFLFASVAMINALWLWQEDGIGISTTLEEQWHPQIVSDGEGGAMMAWRHDVAGLGDIYAQRIDTFGNLQWGPSGVPVTTSSPSSWSQRVTPYDSGMVVVWMQWGDGLDLYAQKIDMGGNPKWLANGVPVCAVSGDSWYPELVTDNMGGVFVVWQDYRDMTLTCDIYAQRLDSVGTTQWNTAGTPICLFAGDQTNPQLAPDDSGGVYIVWQASDIWGQRVDFNGDALWSPNGIPIHTGVGTQETPRIVPNGTGGAILAFRDDNNISAQRLERDGSLPWGTTGVSLCGDPGTQDSPRVVADGAGGAIIVWRDMRNGLGDIYAQRVDSTGSTQWDTDGVAICTATGGQHTPEIAADGFGGAVITWNDNRGSDADVYAQRIDQAGNILWAMDGVAVSTRATNQHFAKISGDGAGGAFLVWQDLRSGNPDIYAQRILWAGMWGPRVEPVITAVTDVPNDQGGKLQLRWLASTLDTVPKDDITYYSLWRRLDAVPPAVSASEMESFAMPVDFDGSAYRMTSDGYAWEWLDNKPARYFETYVATVVSLYDSIGSDPGWQYFMVSAQTDTAWVFYDSQVDSGYSVDNLAPAAPLNVVAIYNTGMGNTLSWDECSDLDFNYFNVYRSTEPGFTPGPENLVESTTSLGWTDPDYDGWNMQYKITAVDFTGNESDATGPETATGVTELELPKSFALYQNVPNPFNPTTTIGFDLPKLARVTLSIYDVTGTLINTLVDGEMAPGRKSIRWDGRDTGGLGVASGVYFYRLETPTFGQSKKMILLR